MKCEKSRNVAKKNISSGFDENFFGYDSDDFKKKSFCREREPVSTTVLNPKACNPLQKKIIIEKKKFDKKIFKKFSNFFIEHFFFPKVIFFLKIV